MRNFIERLRRPSLRATLVAILMLVCVPNLIVVAATLLHAGRSFREISESRLMETARIVAQSVSAEVETTERLLLAAMRLRPENTPGGLGIAGLSDPEATYSAYNLPAGATAAQIAAAGVPAAEVALVTQAVATGRAVVSDILPVAAEGEALRIAVIVPAPEASGRVDVAVMTAGPRYLIQSLSRQGQEGGSVVLAITDSAGRLIGRSVDGERLLGRQVPDWQRLKSLGVPDGSFRATTIEGSGIVFAFDTIPGTPGWVAVAGEGTATFDSRWRTPILTMVAVSSLTLILGLGVALALAGRMMKPVSRLVARARRVASGDPEAAQQDGVAPPALVAEFETLRQSLDAAQAVMGERLAESREAEHLAQESLARLEQAERMARIGSWSWDSATDSFVLSTTLREFCGLPERESSLPAPSLPEYFPPEDHERIMQAFRLCCETGEPYAMAAQFLPPGGERFPAWIRGDAIRDAEGRIVGVAGSVQDITERVEQNARLSALADNLPRGAIFRLERAPGAPFRLTYISAGIEEMTGRDLASVLEDVAGFASSIHPEDAAMLMQALNDSTAPGTVLDREFRIRSTVGREIWVRGRAALRVQPGGTAVWDGLILDISVERRAVNALREAMKAAEQAERAKSDFLATMSHEIRTPMNSVIGMTRLALKMEVDGKLRSYLDKINESASVLLGIINDILDFSKIEAGELELERSVFRTDSVLETLSSITGLRAEEKGLELAFRVAPDVPPFLRGDSLRLGQVLTNLVGNAIKFTAKGDVTVGIENRGVTEGGRVRLLFSVRDTGIGLTQQQISGLFRPFVQADAETARLYGGTGLGLAISRRLVELMGGEIWVESEPGKGATFSFTAEFGEIAADEVAAGAARSALHGLRHRRVLVVDDSSAARIALVEMIAGFGPQVESAGSGDEALALLRQRAIEGRPYEVVMVDWRMPGMDGLEVARHIREDQLLKQMPAILMVTAYGQQLVMSEVNAIGFQGVLIKPVTQSVIFNSLLETLSVLPRATAGQADTGADGDMDQLRAVLSGRRILVVDDNALNREVAADFLDLAGVTVDTAHDGRNAIDRMNETAYDAVLMDVHMPVMNGLEAIREIRQRPEWADLPVIALTAQARVEDVEASTLAGMSGHLTKPIDEMALYHMLGEAIGQRPVATRPMVPKRAATGDAGTSDAQRQRALKARVTARFGGSQQRMSRFVMGFLRDYGRMDSDYAAAAAGGDLESIADFAHRVRGVVGYFEATELHELCGAVEVAARAGDATAVGAATQRMLRLMRECIVDVASLDPGGETGDPDAAPR